MDIAPISIWIFIAWMTALMISFAFPPSQPKIAFSVPAICGALPAMDLTSPEKASVTDTMASLMLPRMLMMYGCNVWKAVTIWGSAFAAKSFAISMT